MNESAVAQLRRQIEGEWELLQRTFTAFATGVARHEFIRARMDHVGSHQETLTKYVGEEQAAHIVAELYTKVMQK